uniref:Adipose-secreted signaling protein n=1 Tax=Castor canadensis TaxID=51338 RepID=A0A8C0WPX6_CASCN
MAAANKGNKPRVRSIRFAAGHDAEGSQSHVHFDEKLHDSVVMVTQESDSSFLVKVCLGLLFWFCGLGQVTLVWFLSSGGNSDPKSWYGNRRVYVMQV